MTLGHLVLAVLMSAYVVVGAGFERRDLLARFGDRYLAYVGRRERPADPVS